MKELYAIGARAASVEIASHRLTSEALVNACIDRIRAREDDVRAWAHVDVEAAIRVARKRDLQSPRSLLHGIPIGIKDIIDTGDMPTEYGSPVYAGHRPQADAACVAILRDAGAVILGKTVTAEFAFQTPGKTRHPGNFAHTPGGSSSGSAAAVADFMVPMGLGTQTGGSTIRPAAYCGVVGFKPSFNVISRAGVKTVSESLDTIGMFARTIEDVRCLNSVLSP